MPSICRLPVPLRSVLDSTVSLYFWIIIFILFKDKDFVQALFNTFKLMLVIPALTIFLSLVFAFILTQGELREKSFYRTVFFFPSVVSMTVVGIVWSFVFIRQEESSIICWIFLTFLLEACLVGEGKTALWCIGAALVWQAIGYYMVMHVASIDGISQEIYEAASIDGATGAQKFFRITIPLLRRSIGTTYILALSGTINLSFTLSNVMTGGGPERCFQCPSAVYVHAGYAECKLWLCDGDRHVYAYACNRACDDLTKTVS